MKQTAVEIFFEDLVHLGYIEYPDESLVQDRLKLALELEKQQAKRMYTEEEVFSIIDKAFHMYASSYRHDASEWFKQFKKK
jgi:hypothetical protein